MEPLLTRALDSISPPKLDMTGKHWQAYESVGYKHVRDFLAWRWTHMYPLQRRVFKTFTLGEFLILIMSVLVFVTITSLGYASNNVHLTGLIPLMPFSMAFATACHNSLITFILGLPFERALFWHKICGYMALTTTVLHGGIAISHEGLEMYESGNPIGVAAIMLVLTSLYPIRRYAFELFYAFHWFFFLLALVFCMIHGAYSVAVGGVLWMIDVAYRYYLARTRITHEVDVQILPAQVIRLQFPSATFPRYKGGQYIFLAVPELSMFQWHPFSISSAPHQDMVSVHIRVLGNWTRELAGLCERMEGGGGGLKVWMEGPYGEPALDIESDRYKCFLFISGGIGITPMQSICNDLLEQHSRGRPLKKLWFIWSCRDKAMVKTMMGGGGGAPSCTPLLTDVAINSHTDGYPPMVESETVLEMGQKKRGKREGRGGGGGYYYQDLETLTPPCLPGRLPLTFQPDLLTRHSGRRFSRVPWEPPTRTPPVAATAGVATAASGEADTLDCDDEPSTGSAAVGAAASTTTTAAAAAATGSTTDHPPCGPQPPPRPSGGGVTSPTAAAAMIPSACIINNSDEGGSGESNAKYPNPPVGGGGGGG